VLDQAVERSGRPDAYQGPNLELARQLYAKFADIDPASMQTAPAGQPPQGCGAAGEGRLVPPSAGSFGQAVIDAAHYLAERAITAGDWERALSASERGLRCCPASDVLLADRAQAAETSGLSVGSLATRALREALKDVDPRLGLIPPDAELDAARVTGADS